ncbi:hypothetical protein NPIL_133961 [Nephila pilipes]|uniref:Uncharacterized protein n=1 Tax=Nephila pilipes TaxID=299642 RepID=A0A8X6NFY4_NEPPI|nr:hypothetical protein NPIL_133961 [Nephila pilipes]
MVPIHIIREYVTQTFYDLPEKLFFDNYHPKVVSVSTINDFLNYISAYIKICITVNRKRQIVFFSNTVNIFNVFYFLNEILKQLIHLTSKFRNRFYSRPLASTRSNHLRPPHRPLLPKQTQEIKSTCPAQQICHLHRFRRLGYLSRHQKIHYRLKNKANPSFTILSTLPTFRHQPSVALSKMAASAFIRITLSEISAVPQTWKRNTKSKTKMK